ncbi:MAG: YceI family protein [Candidatus Promineifilaceae bacterium]|jgi:polyisoprenoid-binding protein YceI
MTWQLDSSHSQIQFTVRHLMISKVRGFFDEFSMDLDYDEEHPENSSVVVTVNTGSANTRDQQRDAHLRAADFFDVENYPTATFESTRVEVTGENKGKIYGDLTIRDVTKEVVVDAQYLGMATDPWGTQHAHFSGSTAIDRRDWGLEWNQGLDTGGVLAGWKVQLDFEVELVNVAEQQPAEAAA